MSDREDEIRRLYASALQRPIGERAAFVAERSGRDEDLRCRVSALLKGQHDTELPGGETASGAVLVSGTQIGTYRIDGPLGAGGMGIVYRATDTKLDRPAAIKVLPENLADTEARRRFQREARMVSSLNHPHIVTVYDAGEYEDRQYLITEYVDGGTLRQWAARTRGWQQIVELLIGVADAIAVAHEAGILHRDIKPENILLAKNGYAKLADFGLAKLLEVDPLADDVLAAIKPGDNSTLIGTAAYMSPEQAQGRALDGRSDVYAFGLVLYELLSGRRRPAERDPRLNGASALPPLGADVPAPLRAIVAKALEPEAEDRYQTMRELVVDLRRLVRRSGLEDDPPSGPSDAPGTWTRSAAPQPRASPRRAAWYAAGAALIAALLLAAYYRDTFSGAATAGTAVAVLPFANETGDADDAISEGLGDALRERLMELPGLSVQARASSVSFRGRDADIRTIAKSLGVEVLINASLRRQGGNLVVSVEVLDDEGFAMWPALRFERAERELQALQQQIAAEVGTLLVPSARAALAAPTPPSTVQSESAKMRLLVGNRLYNQVRDENTVDLDKLEKAIEHYRQATLDEPGSIAAHSRLASAFLYLGDIDEARAPLETALELGASIDLSVKSADLSDLYYTAGLYRLRMRQSGSGQSFHDALVLNPNNVDALQPTLNGCSGMDQLQRLTLFRDAILLDRQTISRYEDYAAYLGTIDDADKLHELGREIETRFPNARGYRALAGLYELAGELDVGIAWALKSLRSQPDQETKQRIADLYARIGDFETAAEFEPEPGVGQLWLQRRFDKLADVAEELMFDRPGDLDVMYYLAFAYNAMGDYSTARRLLEFEEMGAPELSSDLFTNPRDPQIVASYVDALQALELEEARATNLAQHRADWIAARLENGTRSSWFENMLFACAQAQLGKRTEALDALDRVVESHGLVWSPWLQDAPCFQRRLAGEPRYEQVIERIDERKRQLRERLPATLSAHGVADVTPGDGAP